MPCDQLEPFSSFTPAIVLSSFLVQLCVLLFLHFSPQKSGVTEFKFLKSLLLVDALVTLCVSLMPFVHNFSNFCEKSSNLLEMKLHPEWSMKFAFSATIAFSMSFLVTIEWFWLVLRLKYFPMAKCVAFGDKQYQTIASPKKVKTINFVAIMFAFSLALGLACLGEIIPNFISRTPSIVINHPFLFAFEPAAVFILQLAVSFMLLTDSIRHHAFKLSFVIMSTFICISNAIRLYCFHNSRSFQNSFMNFFFEEIWKCRLLNLGSKPCPDSLPAIVAWPDIVLLVLRFLDYIFLFYALHVLLPLKKPLNLFTSIKEIMQPASPSFLNKTTKPKVTVLVSNQSSDGMVETFYSPSPSMNFKDMQIVHLGGTNSPDRGGIAMKQLKSSLDVAKTRSGKHALVRAEVSNPDSYTPQSPQIKNPDHQLVNCPDCAKTIRVATWVNYLPQPTPKRKHFAPHPIRARALGNLDPTGGMAGSPSSSNTFSPVYPLQVPVARNPHINAPTAPSTVSRSFPGSPVLSHRSSSVGSSRKTSSKSAKKADSGTEVLSTRLIPESHQRILSQYNASPVALRRKKPLSPLVTSDRKIENQSVMPSGSQSNPATLRAQRSLAFNEPSSPLEAPPQLPTQESIRPTELNLESGNRISNSTTASRSNQGGSDSFDSEEDTRTEIGLCTSLL